MAEAGRISAVPEKLFSGLKNVKAPDSGAFEKTDW